MTPRVRGPVELILEPWSYLGYAPCLDDTGPGGTLTYNGQRYEVVKNLWWGKYTPSCWVVRP